MLSKYTLDTSYLDMTYPTGSKIFLAQSLLLFTLLL